MLCGPSGVGKTETALALAEALYGGEQNIITINMSEFQEAHTVSTLKGAPPGYVGYGEGGRLTEAVRRKPYSVVLLDEVEKAHPDVHEMFFQVFDKGQMEDGIGPAHRFQEHADHPDLQCRHRSHHGARRRSRVSRRSGGARRRRCGRSCYASSRRRCSGASSTIPYFPLSPEMLSGIVRLQLEPHRQAHRATTTRRPSSMTTPWSITSSRNATIPDSGGRMIDNIITNTLLPSLSREFLKRSLAKEELREARVTVSAGAFGFEWR